MSARVLIVTWGGGGNVPPALNLGVRLARRGHEVRILGWSSTARPALDAGLEFSSLSTPQVPPGRTLDDVWDELVDPKLHGDATVEEILTVARSFGADLLVIDAMMGAAFKAAARLGVPTAALVHMRYAPFVNIWGDGLMHASTLGLLASADLVLALTAPAFDDLPDALPANTTFVGPILAPVDAIASASPELPSPELPSPELLLPELLEPGPPWVLVSLSTTAQHQQEALPAILEGVGALPIRVLLTLGGVLPVESVMVPDNVTVRSFVPHDRVLPHMSAVLCHGGLSTVTASLAHGVPLVCIPQGRDQPGNAERVRACGVGEALSPDAGAAEIADALGRVLNDGGFRAAARRFAAPDSGARAAELVEGLLDADRTAFATTG
jgi:UDP:flavonoid glycosyltransferase YjiC (YdhE family)